MRLRVSCSRADRSKQSYRIDGRRYEAALRLSEGLSLCPEPEDLSKILSEQLRELLDFLQFYIIGYKEKSSEVEWAVVGREKSLMAAHADVPTDERVPARLKQGIAAQGFTLARSFLFP